MSKKYFDKSCKNSRVKIKDVITIISLKFGPTLASPGVKT